MASTTIGIGAALILLGLGGYFGTGTSSPTALIPAAFGLLLVLLGGLARDPNRRKMAMHIAVVIGLLGFLGALRGIPATITLLSGGTVARPAAAISQAIMAVLMLIFVALCVRSFIEARRARVGKA